MSRKGRNLAAILLTNILNSLKPRRFRGDLVGKDYLGNKYYEIPGATRKLSSRWFEPPGGEKNFDHEIPAEWEAWLRGRRKIPPSVEEVEKNLKIMLQTKENAEALYKEYKMPEAVKPITGKVPFPKLEGYESYPGEKSKS